MHGLFRRRNLPHLDREGGTYFVTLCLAGSLPASGTLAISRHWRKRALAPPPAGISADEWRRRCSAAAFVDYDRVLDSSSPLTWLADQRLAGIVRDSLLHGHGHRYQLLAYVIMGSHCHVVFSTTSNGVTDPAGNDCTRRRSAREAVMLSLKRYTAVSCNRVLGRRGPFWQAESYDRLVRTPAELERVVSYVERNPVKAGLCREPEDWEWSSARSRKP